MFSTSTTGYRPFAAIASNSIYLTGFRRILDSIDLRLMIFFASSYFESCITFKNLLKKLFTQR